jgi:hypothetical protein
MSSRLICVLVGCQERLECCYVEDGTYLHASCGVYRGKWMIEVLRTVRGLWRGLTLFFFCYFVSLDNNFYSFL